MFAAITVQLAIGYAGIAVGLIWRSFLTSSPNKGHKESHPQSKVQPKVSLFSIGQKLKTKRDCIVTVISTAGENPVVQFQDEMKTINHTDLFIVHSSAWDFKVGDKVRVRAEVGVPRYAWTGDTFLQGRELPDKSSSVTHKSIGVITMIPNEASYVLIDFPGHNDWKGDIEEIDVVPPAAISTSDQPLRRAKRPTSSPQFEGQSVFLPNPNLVYLSRTVIPLPAMPVANESSRNESTKSCAVVSDATANNNIGMARIEATTLVN